MIDGAQLIAWGFKPGPFFKETYSEAKRLEAEGLAHDEIFRRLQAAAPREMPLRDAPLPYAMFLDAETDLERQNAAAVARHMDALMLVPTLVAGAVMPDACPSGMQIGTIPVGGAVAAKDAIHPGFHSSDVCCSVALTVFKHDADPKKLLDAVQRTTHFGPGGRRHPVKLNPALMERVAGNKFLQGLDNLAVGHFATQGDGNHFAYVGRLKSSGQLALVTHHGSRGLGAELYKRGMAAAQKHTARVAPKIASHNAWIPASTPDGEAYWEALQIVRAWTKASHFALHDLALAETRNAVEDRFWNEHNFVFQKSDGLFYHGKGATPSWSGYSEDDDGRTLIPLNMSEPILIVSHKDRKEALGFAPHGAGRNSSRTKHLREHGDALKEELSRLAQQGLDVRSYFDTPDLSELPSAYKNAAAVRSQIEKYKLADVVDEVVPYGSIMAGDWQVNAPWRKKKAKNK